MVMFADFSTAYDKPFVMGPPPSQVRPECTAPNCFIGSYPPITPAGQVGPYFVNTWFLQDNRRREIAGPVVIHSGMLGKCNS
jgi:hypothetical protein